MKIAFKRLVLRNVAHFDELDLPLGDATEDLVLLRGANGHGKTTLFRALCWVVFGQDSLYFHGVQPYESLRLIGSAGDEEHVGEIEFEYNGKDYRIVRSVTSTDLPGRNGGIKGEKYRVHQWQAGTWVEAGGQAEEELAESFFPPSLADLLFVNKDKVTRVIDYMRNLSGEDEVTGAVDRLLAIDMLRDARKRVHERGRECESEANAKIGDGGDLAKLIKARDALETAVADAEESRDHNKGEQEKADQALTVLNGELQALEQKENHKLYQELHDAEGEVRQAVAVYRDAAANLRSVAISEAAFAPMFHGPLTNCAIVLEELRQDGVIPQAELPMLRRILHDGKCVCGETDVPPGSAVADRLLEQIRRSQEFEQGANRLERVRGDIDDLLQRQQRGAWANAVRARVQVSGVAKQTLDDANEVLTKIKTRVADYEAGGVDKRLRQLRDLVKDQETIASRAELTAHIADARLKGGTDRMGTQHESLTARARSANAKVSNRQNQSRDARPLQRAADAAAQLVDVLEEIIRRIQTEQVQTVSDRMNEIFGAITDHGRSLEEGESPLTLTRRVGVRETQAGSGRFQLFAEGSGGPRSIAMLNGASQTALTVAFLLALLENADQPIPIVTDSLLHNVSGPTKARLTAHLLAHQSQRIIFFTHSDVSEASTGSLLSNRGLTYTLSNADARGDLANEPVPGPGGRAMVCTCGPQEYCETCELSDAATSGLTKSDSERVA